MEKRRRRDNNGRDLCVCYQWRLIGFDFLHSKFLYSAEVERPKTQSTRRTRRKRDDFLLLLLLLLFPFLFPFVCARPPVDSQPAHSRLSLPAFKLLVKTLRKGPRLRERYLLRFWGSAGCRSFVRVGRVRPTAMHDMHFGFEIKFWFLSFSLSVFLSFFLSMRAPMVAIGSPGALLGN